MANEKRLTDAEFEAEIRRRLREGWIAPDKRRLLRQVLILHRGIKRYCEERVRRLSNDQLLNNWAAAPSEFAGKLIDLSGAPDRQLLQAVSFKDTGLAADRDLLADSAIAELAKRANNLRLTVADYIRRKSRQRG
jgi:hypothetical protein